MFRLGPIVTTVLILGAMAAGLASLVAYVRAEADARIRAEIEADFAAVAVADSVMPAMPAMMMLHDQSKSGFAYIVINPATREHIAGTLTSWPPEQPDGQGWVRIDRGPAKSMLGRVGKLDGHFPVLIARSTAAQDNVRDRTLIGGGTFMLLAFGLSLLSARLELARLRTRLRRFDDALAAFASGEEVARIRDPGRDLLARMAQKIDATLNQLGRMIKANRVIAETVAHELLNPASLAISNIDRAASPEDAVAGVRRGMVELQNIASGILAINNVRTAPIEMEALDLAVVAESIAEPFRDAAVAMGLSLHTDLRPAPIFGAVELVRGLVLNLVDNAIKYSAPPGRIDVETFADDEDSVLRVLDQGPGTAGLPPNKGDPLARGANAVGKHGHGLGLAAVYAIVERHDARVTFADRPDGPGLIVECRWRCHDATIGAPYMSRKEIESN